ncbi:hypothetical protein GCM10010182_00390 [Actinomadura cremea]|nr:hypothetical protein GCM10010182_00390 [Actinomadura cremea]
MGKPAEQTHTSALIKGAAAYELLMGAVGTETSPSEDYDRVTYPSGEPDKPVEQARAAKTAPAE